MYKFFVFFFVFLLLFNHNVDSHTLNVQGTVKSNRILINHALVTFINEADTTIKYSAVTDNLGKYQIGLHTSIGHENNFPADFQLAQNYPNPFSSSTAIAYTVDEQSEIKVTIYDILGREIRQFSAGFQTAGVHQIVWDGRNRLGQKVASGVYFYRLQSDGKSMVRKMILNSGLQNSISMQQIKIPQMSLTSRVKNKTFEGVNYIISIKNTDDSSPFIKVKQINNIQVSNDTTINFEVDYIPTVTINLDSLHQVIRGFGASNILLWRPDMTASEFETAFGAEEGQLGFTILRLMVEADKNRWNLYVPTAKAAFDTGAIIIASPWYAPSEMVETVGGVSRVKHDMYDEYAAHLDSFVAYMAENDVPIYGISIQNEPDITDQWTSWTANEIFTFMKENAHAVTGTKVMAPESYHFDRAYSDPILNDSLACANTDIICGHIYGGGLASYPLAEQKDKEVWMTEYLINSGNPPANLDIDTGWTGAIQTAQSINNSMNAKMSAYVWWYIVRYYGPIADGTYASKGEVTKKGYVMSQFSRFVRPGDHRVESSVYPPIVANIFISAYRDSLSSKEVFIAINTSSSIEEVAFKFQNRIKSMFTPYTTTETKNVIQGEDIYLGTNSVILNLEASSITTFVSND
ncbi:MAG: T9SS type A sorting domain-containing protein [Calditrichaceae bacterium]|nr:T9SS type A sorting domain-containing protein [Calditrichaceae bacterium]